MTCVFAVRRTGQVEVWLNGERVAIAPSWFIAFKYARDLQAYIHVYVRVSDTERRGLNDTVFHRDTSSTYGLRDDCARVHTRRDSRAV